MMNGTLKKVYLYDDTLGAGGPNPSVVVAIKDSPIQW